MPCVGREMVYVHNNIVKLFVPTFQFDVSTYGVDPHVVDDWPR